MTAVVIRPAEPADCDAVAEVWLAGWLSTGLSTGDDPTPAQMRARVDEDLAKGCTFTVAAANDRARAFYERQGMTLTGIGPRPDKPERIVAHYRWSPS